jgi:hypothetical protein
MKKDRYLLFPKQKLLAKARKCRTKAMWTEDKNGNRMREKKIECCVYVCIYGWIERLLQNLPFDKRANNF